MSELRGIPILVESATGDPVGSGNAVPVVHEVRHALERLITRGETTRIDLHSMPFGPGDEERLAALLGSGEVRATVDALGPTEIRETAIPGVWLVDYRSAEGERLALHIEIAPIPEILRTQPEDIATAVAALDARLVAYRDTGPNTGATDAARPDTPGEAQ